MGTCSGLTPPAQALEAVQVTDACSDAADQAVWTKTGKTNFAADLNKCGHHCLGTLTGCTASHCMFDCMEDAQGSKCKTCVDANCTPAFKTCSGLTPPAQALEAVQV